jgi:hypothetical protein
VKITFPLFPAAGPAVEFRRERDVAWNLEGVRHHSLTETYFVSRRTLLVGGRSYLIAGVASQPKRRQPRSLFPHRTQFGLVFGHCLLAFTQLLFLLEQRGSATGTAVFGANQTALAATSVAGRTFA